MQKNLSGPLILDQPCDQIDAELTNRLLDHARRAAATRLSAITDVNVRSRASKATFECDARSAGELLQLCIRAVTSALSVWANSDPALRWLWFIRRLPSRVFSGVLPTTFGYDRTLAEVISGHSVASASGARGDGASLANQITPAGLARVARFCEGVRFLSDLHGRIPLGWQRRADPLQKGRVAHRSSGRAHSERGTRLVAIATKETHRS